MTGFSRRALLKEIGLLSLPVVLTNFLETTVAVVDTLMIGQLGPEALAAIGLANAIRALLLIMVLSVSVGSMSLIAQAKGAQDEDRMREVTRQSLLAGLVVGILLGMAGYLLAEPLLNLMDQSGNVEVVAEATAYLRVIFLGVPFMMLQVVAVRLMQGAGDMQTPLYLTFVVVLLNIGFDYIFIFGFWEIPAYGVMGAALGTIAARALSFGAALLLFLSGRNVIRLHLSKWKRNLQMQRDILDIGLPSGVQGVFRRGANLILLSLLTATQLGTLGAAVMAIIIQLEALMAQPIVGINVASTSLIGRDLGRWQTRQAFRKGNAAVLLGILMMSVFTLLAFLYPATIIGWFDPSANEMVIEGAHWYFMTALLSMPLAAASIVISGNLRGAGDTKPAMISTLAFRNVATLVLAWLFAFHLEMDYFGIWLAILIGRSLDAITMIWIWQRKKWLEVSLRKSELYRRHLVALSKSTRRAFLKNVREPILADETAIEQILDRGILYRLPNSPGKFYTFDSQGYYLKEE